MYSHLHMHMRHSKTKGIEHKTLRIAVRNIWFCQCCGAWICKGCKGFIGQELVFACGTFCYQNVKILIRVFGELDLFVNEFWKCQCTFLDILRKKHL